MTYIITRVSAYIILPLMLLLAGAQYALADHSNDPWFPVDQQNCWSIEDEFQCEQQFNTCTFIEGFCVYVSEYSLLADSCYEPPECGNYVCEKDENYTNCNQDCNSMCGDFLCDNTLESPSSCPSDCSECGDGICGLGEDAESCVQDCGIEMPSTCKDGVCSGSETEDNCPFDCLVVEFCGDLICGQDETIDSCPDDCIVLTCGDNVCEGKEETLGICPEDCGSVCGNNVCDLSEEDNGTCPQDCDDTTTCVDDCDEADESSSSPVCGDANLNTDAGEECDDGNTQDNDGCSAVCTIELYALPQCSIQGCGNYIVETGEECDDGPVNAYACDLDCSYPVCGDGLTNEIAGEQCDDGNTQNGDGCDSQCYYEGY